MNRKANLRNVFRIFVPLLTLVTSVAAMAQAAVCSKQTIRDAMQNHTFQYAGDSIFWSGMFDKPIIGKAAGEEASKKMEAEGPMKNPVFANHPQQMVVSESGDMTYGIGYGSPSMARARSRRR
jgi:hypothetical protein